MTPPTASLQRPVAEHQNWTDPVHFSNTTLSYPTRAPTDEPVHSSNTTSSYPTSAQTEAVESSTFTLPPSSRLRPGRERGYLLSMTHTQQISGALHGYTDLATLGALLNLSTVEPYVVDTSLVGVPYVKDAQYELKLCDIYDAHMLKSTLKMCSSYNDHEMSTFEDFLERASREVIFVYMLTSFNRGQKFRLAGNKRIIEIGTTGNATQKFLERLNRWAVHISPLNPPGFYISRVFVIDAQPMKALHLSEYWAQPFAGKLQDMALQRYCLTIGRLFTMYQTVTVSIIFQSLSTDLAAPSIMSATARLSLMLQTYLV